MNLHLWFGLGYSSSIIAKLILIDWYALISYENLDLIGKCRFGFILEIGDCRIGAIHCHPLNPQTIVVSAIHRRGRRRREISTTSTGKFKSSKKEDWSCNKTSIRKIGWKRGTKTKSKSPPISWNKYLPWITPGILWPLAMQQVQMEISWIIRLHEIWILRKTLTSHYWNYHCPFPSKNRLGSAFVPICIRFFLGFQDILRIFRSDLCPSLYL